MTRSCFDGARLSDPRAHWVTVTVGDSSFRPRCRTCGWAGASVVARSVAVDAAMAHGDLVEAPR